MFSKDTYVRRRDTLKQLVKSGLIVLFGNNNAPANYPGNGYAFRQDSSFLYYFGQKREGLVGVIDIDNNKEYLIGDDIDIDDIIWYGSVDSVKDLASQVGVTNSAPMAQLQVLVDAVQQEGRKIHFIPPYRHDIQIQLMDLLGVYPSQQKEEASMDLIMAIIKMRSTKELQEIEELDRIAEVGYKMHTRAMKLCKPGVTEQYIAGVINGIADSYGSKVSFLTILSQHGEIMHGTPSPNLLESGRLMLCDAGAESNDFYCSDNTRTMPVNGKFTQKQLDIYSIVEACHDYALEVSKPGVTYKSVHLGVARMMTEKLKALGLMKGDVDAAVASGAHALFLPHGLGHMMGMDVHDMENLDQHNVGFDAETRPSDQFGLNALRMGRQLEEGFVVTDEPGIYFIPALIDQWKANGTNAEFLNFDKIETYKNFGGIRIEDDLLITKDGCRFLGKNRIPYHPKDVEAFMADN